MITIHADTDENAIKFTISNGNIGVVFAMDIQEAQAASEGLRIATETLLNYKTRENPEARH
jgi:DUF4097 and DUF4098 domain-containing protein YvlB